MPSKTAQPTLRTPRHARPPDHYGVPVDTAAQTTSALRLLRSAPALSLDEAATKTSVPAAKITRSIRELPTMGVCAEHGAAAAQR